MGTKEEKHLHMDTDEDKQLAMDTKQETKPQVTVFLPSLSLHICIWRRAEFFTLKLIFLLTYQLTSNSCELCVEWSGWENHSLCGSGQWRSSCSCSHRGWGWFGNIWRNKIWESTWSGSLFNKERTASGEITPLWKEACTISRDLDSEREGSTWYGMMFVWANYACFVVLQSSFLIPYPEEVFSLCVLWIVNSLYVQGSGAPTTSLLSTNAAVYLNVCSYMNK